MFARQTSGSGEDERTLEAISPVASPFVLTPMERKVSDAMGTSVHAPEMVDKDEYSECLDVLFRRAAAHHPDCLALEGASFQMTYRELNEVTDKLGAFLRLTYGARPESVVGIFMDRCEEYVIGLLATIKAGAAYCPVELAYPGPLLLSVFDQVAPCVTLSKTEFAKNIPSELSQYLLDDGWQADVQGADVSVLSTDRSTPDSLVYIVFSGGSTGKPKGIEGPIQSCVASYLWRYSISGYKPGARVGCNVFFVWEILRPLLRGAAVLVIPDSIIFSAVELVEFLKTKQVTECLFTPSLFETILASMAASKLSNLTERLPALQVIWLNGEVLTTKLLEASQRALPNAKFYNTYSISECGEVCAAESELDHSREFCHVGKVASFCGFMVMDELFNPVLKGEKGELWVSGQGLGRGYLNNPKVTEERFVMRDGTRWYRSGDLARELPTGNFEILGRCDFMVKVRGYSVVLEAVEAALLKRAGLFACCVIAEGKEGEDKRVVAYLVPCVTSELHGRMDVTKLEIDQYGRCLKLFTEMSKELPHYAVPGVYVKMPNGLPLIVASAKTDRKGLPKPPARPPVIDLPEGTQYDGGSAAQCISLCEYVLSLPSGTLSGNSSFFAFGGHSLLATRLITKLQSIGGPAISVVDFMRAPTPDGLRQICTGKTEVEAFHHLPKEVEKHLPSDKAMDICTRAYWRFVVFANAHNRVLLTGTTGFVGAYLLKELNENTDSQVFCLVRVSATSDNSFDEASKRLQANLDQQGIKLDMSRVHAIPGDVSMGNLGLAHEDFMHMKQLIDVVIHAAAVVNLIYPYDLLEAINVTGTANIVDFARQGKVKALHYISTNGIFPEEGKTMTFKEKDVPSHAHLKSGYGQTKWVAERIVARAYDNGLPGAIYRLGNAAGPASSSIVGWNLQDSNFLFVKHCLEKQQVPDVPTWSMEFTPVDFIAKVVIKSMLELQNANHKTFHLMNPNKMTFQQFSQAAARIGYPLAKVSVSDWCAALDGPDALALSEKNLELLMGRHHTYDVTNTVDLAKSLGIEYPLPRADDVQNMVQVLLKQNLLSVPVKADGRLTGKVGIVTGASSGIGKAVASALAQEGMKVVMVSRSMAKLQEAAKSVPGAVCMTADVVDRKAVQAMVKEVVSTFHQVDLLVNCAGVMYFTLMKNLHYDEWEQTIDINCKGTVNACGAVFPHMLGAKRGHIVNISSDAAKTVFPALTVYNAAKAFVNVFSKGLRAECVGTGLRVTDIQPGDTATNLLMTNSDQEAADKMGVSIGKVVGEGGGRAAVLDPEDIGAAVVYAVTAPAHVGVHEILIEPRDQMFGDPTAMNS